MKNKYSIDIVVPCGRPDSIITRKCINQLIRIKMVFNKINIYIAGPIKKNYFGSEVHYLTTKKIIFPSSARNIAGFKGNGEYILFIDDDCFITNKEFKKLLVILNTADYEMVAAKITSANNTIKNMIHDFAGFTYQQLPKRLDSSNLKNILFVTAFLLVKRQIFENQNGFDENLRYFEDCDFVLRCNQTQIKKLYAGDINILHYHSRKTLLSIIKVQFLSGLEYFKFSKREKFNFLYFIKIPISSLASTISALKWNISYLPKIILISPMIYLIFLVHISARYIGGKKK